MEQFEQLLTCAICLDRYRNPKLLPCQHSFCMEPCMDGLVDYVRRQVKCPECRAEHRIPYQVINFLKDFFPNIVNRISYCFVGSASVSNQRHSSKIFRITHRNYWRIARSDERSNHGTMWSVLRKKLLLFVCSL